ncbi:uncharacterized protein MELLADRAFT_124268 [Melampsora larici-populina 98AG31]|uniref:Secreted protein n=1 Tax=Melampsora larici-populina (strain 98AG31 / pathotype 3-4-7) TaxID=747676 RepID=F4R7U2_MELLP|nr:uncharacterized protein MELLADRAFT_124268 [Melampsora larici-populina 98AG31]EGG11725.1 secreted protein [Melampsora larici-populina 98AG31]
MKGVHFRGIILLSLVLSVTIIPIMCELLDDTERLEVMGFSDGDRLRARLQEDDNGPASERHSCSSRPCEDHDSCLHSGCDRGCEAGTCRG